MMHYNYQFDEKGNRIPPNEYFASKKDEMMNNTINPIQVFINAMCADIHKFNMKWWQDPKTGKPIERNKGELLMLMVSELAEGMEGERKNLMDDKLPHRKMIEVELADCVIRIMDYAGAYGLDLGGAIFEKCEYNKTREDHKHEARELANGKKW